MRRPPLLVLLGLTGVAGGWWVAWTAGAPRSGDADLERSVRRRDIAFYARRAERDPKGAADLAQLAGLFLQLGRENGDVAHIRRAEQTARRSLARRESRNAKAQVVLASSLLAQHRFPEALEAARRLVAIDPDVPSHRALLGEIQLELGAYDAARATFGAIAGAWRNLAVAPRLARWAEIEGRTPEARYVLRAALDEARRRRDLPREQVAWFYLRVGDLELRNGRLREAERALEAGLEAAPGDGRLLAAFARLEAARGRWRRVVALGERAVSALPDIGTLALLGDAHAALGDTARAETWFAAAERAAAQSPEPFNRAWTLFRLEHGRRLDETVAILRREIAVRQDVYGFDQLAWGLYLAGDYREARAAMTQALRMGTRDAVLLFHAGMIERALGDRSAARRYTRLALEVNPYFHPRFAAVARAALDSLDAPTLHNLRRIRSTPMWSVFHRLNTTPIPSAHSDRLNSFTSICTSTEN